MKHLHDTLIDFSSVAHSQEQKGIKKYGQPLDPDDSYDWLEMAKEEQVDGYKYLLAEQVRRNRVIDDIRQIIKTGVHPDIYDKISNLLNQLEGKYDEGKD